MEGVRTFAVLQQGEKGGLTWTPSLVHLRNCAAQRPSDSKGPSKTLFPILSDDLHIRLNFEQSRGMGENAAGCEGGYFEMPFRPLVPDLRYTHP